MRVKLTPEDLKNGNGFELLTEVSHQELRKFVVSQILEVKHIIRAYSVYQVVMIAIFLFLFTKSIIAAFSGSPEFLFAIGLSALFSFSALIVIHEFLHALAYWVNGSRNISFGFVRKEFIFYALADRQVIASRPFYAIALTPFIVVKLSCIIGSVVFLNGAPMYFFLSVMCLHSLFCAGDMAMLAFYHQHRGKEIYNFDDRSEGKTYFYTREVKEKVKSKNTDTFYTDL